MNEYLSQKIRVLSLILMVFVVYIHAYNMSVNFQAETLYVAKGYNSLIQNFISWGIARIAVPMFFLISGYLFFFNIEAGEMDQLVRKIKSRMRTLALPFLLWSILGILFYLFLQTFPPSQRFFSREPIRDYALGDYIYRVFADPVPYQFWYVRDLFILSVFSPLISWLLRNFSPRYLLIAFVLWFIEFDYIIIRPESILFFSLGSLIAIRKLWILHYQIPLAYLQVFTAIWFLLIGIKTYMSYLAIESFWIHNTLMKLSLLCGMLSLWGYLNLHKMNKSLLKWLLFLSQYTFFLFATHEPLLKIYKRIGYVLLGNSESVALLLYLIIPILLITTCILVGMALKKSLPKVYGALTGGR